MTKTVIWAVGDADTSVALQIGNMIAADNPYKFIYLGDVYESGQPAEYVQRYDPYFGKLRNITIPCPGNHDWMSQLVGFRSYWGQDIPLWSSLEIPGWKLICLDSESPHNPGDPQHNFLLHECQITTAKIALFFHRHRYSSDGHFDQPDVQTFIDAVGRNCLVVSGHTHNMQRFHMTHGAVQIVAGCGGRELYAVNKADPRLNFSAQAFGACRLAFFADGSVKHRFVDVSGKILDEVSIKP